jgi:hypothetical protein
MNHSCRRFPRPHSSFLFAAILLLTCLLILSCSQDNYEKGDGTYSLLQADFVEAYTNGQKQAYRVLTDNDEQLSLQVPISKDWLAKADTVYRAIIYYNKVGQTAEVVSLNRMNVAPITPKDSVKKGMKTDPINMESVWVSKNKRYLNAGFYVKSGTTDDPNAIHRLGIVADTLVANPDSTHTLCLKLYHDQGGMPQYYSVHSYFSIALQGIEADSIALTVNTFKGLFEKRLPIK